MVTIAPAAPAEPARSGVAPEAVEACADDFKPWSAQQAREWRAANPALSPWPAVWVQAGAGLVVVAVAWLVSGGQGSAIRSTAYGALAAWLPAVLFARLVARRMRQQTNAAGALLALMVGEGIKIALTVGLLLAAPLWLAQVHWLALLAGFVVTIKAAWVALWWSSTHRPARAGGA